MEETTKPPGELRILGVLLILIATANIFTYAGFLISLAEIKFFNMPLISVALTPFTIFASILEYWIAYFIFLKRKKVKNATWYVYFASGIQIMPPVTIQSILGTIFVLLGICFMNKPEVKEYLDP